MKRSGLRRSSHPQIDVQISKIYFYKIKKKWKIEKIKTRRNFVALFDLRSKATEYPLFSQWSSSRIRRLGKVTGATPVWDPTTAWRYTRVGRPFKSTLTEHIIIPSFSRQHTSTRKIIIHSAHNTRVVFLRCCIATFICLRRKRRTDLFIINNIIFNTDLCFYVTENFHGVVSQTPNSSTRAGKGVRGGTSPRWTFYFTEQQ